MLSKSLAQTSMRESPVVETGRDPRSAQWFYAWTSQVSFLAHLIKAATNYNFKKGSSNDKYLSYLNGLELPIQVDLERINNTLEGLSKKKRRYGIKKIDSKWKCLIYDRKRVVRSTVIVNRFN